MFNDINLSNALALIDKPVWVITEVRGRNKNNRTYSKSRSKNVIYPATIKCAGVARVFSQQRGYRLPEMYRHRRYRHKGRYRHRDLLRPSE